MRCACWNLLELKPIHEACHHHPIIQSHTHRIRRPLAQPDFGSNMKTRRKKHPKKKQQSQNWIPWTASTDTRNYEKFQALRSRPREASASEAAPTVAPSAARMAELVASLKAHAEAPVVGISLFRRFNVASYISYYNLLQYHVIYCHIISKELPKQRLAGCWRFYPEMSKSCKIQGVYTSLKFIKHLL